MTQQELYNANRHQTSHTGNVGAGTSSAPPPEPAPAPVPEPVPEPAPEPAPKPASKNVGIGTTS